MKLKVYNKKNTNKKVGKSYIRITNKGAITLSGTLMDELELEVGSKVSFAQSEDIGKEHEWFLFKDEENGIACRKAAAKGLMFSNAYIANKIFKVLNVTESSISIPVATLPYNDEDDKLEVEEGNDETKYYAILTKSVLKEDRHE